LSRPVSVNLAELNFVAALESPKISLPQAHKARAFSMLHGQLIVLLQLFTNVICREEVSSVGTCEASRKRMRRREGKAEVEIPEEK
jgi:hypothetical protein